MPVDPDGFTDQRVLIIGKGNSAFETADNLTEHAAVIHVAGPRSINFAWRTHFIGHLRAVNNNFLDTYQLKTQNMVLDGDILRIERRADDYLVTFAYARRDKVVQLAYDRVITCTGFRMDASIFAADCRPELTINDRFPALTAEWESVNVPGLYFAGTLTQSRDFKKYTSAFIHGFRYGIRALARMLDQKYHGIEWPHRTLPRGLARRRGARPDQPHVRRCSSSSASSVTWSRRTGGTTRRCRWTTCPFADCFTISLEYGAGHDAIDPFDVEAGRDWEADKTHDDRYLHPVIRRRRDHQVVATLRLPEDICNDWTDEKVYRAPLRALHRGRLGDRCRWGRRRDDRRPARPGQRARLRGGRARPPRPGVLRLLRQRRAGRGHRRRQRGGVPAPHPDPPGPARLRAAAAGHDRARHGRVDAGPDRADRVPPPGLRRRPRWRPAARPPPPTSR